jgi:hypothetical protein
MLTKAKRQSESVQGLGAWRVDARHGVWLGPCHLIQASGDHRFSPVNQTRLDAISHLLWPAMDIPVGLAIALDTAAHYLGQGDTIAVKLCLRRLNLPE